MKQNIKNRVLELIKKHKTRDVFELIDKMNIELLYQPLDSTVNGFYQYYKRNRLIHINESLSPLQTIHVIAHEIGHAVLHTKCNTIHLQCSTYYSKNKLELEANVFAAELLIKDELFTLHKNSTIDEIAASEKLPKELIRLKLELLKVNPY